VNLGGQFAFIDDEGEPYLWRAVGLERQLWLSLPEFGVPRPTGSPFSYPSPTPHHDSVGNPTPIIHRRQPIDHARRSAREQRRKRQRPPNR
jgi:hypothetical protein